MEGDGHDGVLGESPSDNAVGTMLGYFPMRNVTGCSTGARASVRRGGEQAGSAKTECISGEVRKARPGEVIVTALGSDVAREGCHLKLGVVVVSIVL